MVLIIGASGAVGIPLIKELVARGAKLKALTSNEASAKNLRGDSMEDVIFSGSSARAPVGKANVELFFDNSVNMLDLKFAKYI